MTEGRARQRWLHVAPGAALLLGGAAILGTAWLGGRTFPNGMLNALGVLFIALVIITAVSELIVLALFTRAFFRGTANPASTDSLLVALGLTPFAGLVAIWVCCITTNSHV